MEMKIQTFVFRRKNCLLQKGHNMNERERLLTLLGGRQPDTIPWFADLSYIYFSLNERDMLAKKYLGEEGYLNFYADLGAGISFYAPFLWRTEYKKEISYSESIAGDVKTCMYDTPLGRITSKEQYSRISFCWAYTKHFVETIEDLRIMLYIHENARYFENYAAFEKVDRLWNEHGIACGMTPISSAPIQKLISRWAGLKNAMDIYMDHTDEFEEILERLGNSEDEIFRIICASPAQFVEFPENLSSEVTGRNFFLKYNSPYYKKRNTSLHAMGKFTAIHIDGTLRSCLPLLADCGFDAAEAVTPMPVGDVEPEDLRKTAGDRIVIWGGLPGPVFTPIFDEDAFESYLAKIIKIAKEDGHFVIGVADQVPPDGILARVKKVREFIDGGI
jgi:hypothetical protein